MRLWIRSRIGLGIIVRDRARDWYRVRASFRVCVVG